MSVNKYLASELKGLSSYGAYAGSATAGEAIDKLIAIISQEHTTAQRGMLDEMSPQANRQLIVELNALKAAVGTFEEPA